jgi:chromosome segregation ATPase
MENFKKISSLILLGILVISLFLNVRSCTKIDKDKYKHLEDANKSLQSSRDSLIRINKSLKKEFSSLQDSIDKRDVIIFKLRGDLLQSDKRLKSANDEVNRLQKEKKDTDKKIEDLLKNPIRRNDDDLINSLKNKVKP